MSEKEFHDPKLAINKVYTKTGDRGTTSLAGGQRVPKNHPRIDAYGTVDELNAFTGGLVRTLMDEMPDGEERQWFLEVLQRIQHELFNLGSILATPPEDIHLDQPRIRAAEICQLEREIDRCNGSLPTLRSFVLPGGSRSSTDLHLCRTVCRRAERLLVSMGETIPPECLRYLNRLSDAFFVWSRWINLVLGGREVLWQPNKAASSR